MPATSEYESDPVEVHDLLESSYYKGCFFGGQEEFEHGAMVDIINAMIIKPEYFQSPEGEKSTPFTEIQLWDCEIPEADFIMLVSKLPETQVTKISLTEMEAIPTSVVDELIKVLPLLTLERFEFGTDGTLDWSIDVAVYTAALKGKVKHVVLRELTSESAVRAILHEIQTTDNHVNHIDFACTDVVFTPALFDNFIQFIRNTPNITEYKLLGRCFSDAQRHVLIETLSETGKNASVIADWYDE